eukprot:scaffold7808_cov184-Amphora_coffeaeformis.AAC.9
MHVLQATSPSDIMFGNTSGFDYYEGNHNAELKPGDDDANEATTMASHRPGTSGKEEPMMTEQSPCYPLPVPNTTNVQGSHDTVTAAIATTTDATTATEAPYSDWDVLCEKGGRANQHAGNRVFLRLIQRNKALYRTLSIKQDRDLLIQSILLAIHQNGGRFRQRATEASASSGLGNSNSSNQKKEEWQTVTWDRAYQKARQALREPDRNTHKAAVAANQAAKAAASASGTAMWSSLPTIIPTRNIANSTCTCKRRSLLDDDDDEEDTCQDNKTNHHQTMQSNNHRAAVLNTAMQNIHHILEANDTSFPLLEAAAAAGRAPYEIPPPHHAEGYHQHQPQQRFETSLDACMAPPPPPNLQRHPSGPAPPLETLLERQDSLNITHLLEVVEDCRREEGVEQQHDDEQTYLPPPSPLQPRWYG